QDRHGLRVYPGLLGTLGNEQRRGVDVAGGENEPALARYEFDRRAGANSKSDLDPAFHSVGKLRDLSGGRRSEEHTSELQSRSDLHSFPTRRSSDLRIAMVYVFILVFWALWGMSNGVEWTLQAEKMNLHWLGMNLIAAQVQTANPILILLFIPLVNYVIYPAV